MGVEGDGRITLAPGLEDVDVTFRRRRRAGPGERALSTVARRGFAPITSVTETDQHNALVTKAITKTAR